MRFVIADWETFYDSKTYTLSKLSTEAYVRDRRFEAHGVAIKWSPDMPARWYDERQARYILAQEDWSNTFMMHHHAQFDSLIESHHYNVHPKMFGCTLSMARLMLGNHLSASLEQVRKHFGMPSKRTPYGLFDGKHWNELTRDIQEQIADGACDEVESIWHIFCKFIQQGFPREELGVIDCTIKMFTQPMLRGDTDLLASIWEREEKEKAGRLAALNVDGAALRSSEKFAELLRAEGIEPETKPGKNGNNYAFAKTDQFMRDLQEHPNERIRTLAEARLGEKSTLMQTRAETLGWMASRGAMPVYLSYCGAHTRRWSGGDSANWQNFRRGSDLRKAIMAPDGHLLAPIDLSQIECRILCWLAGQEDYVEKFRRGEDPYVGMASKAYGFAVTKAHTKERGTGKQLVLSCGYQSGAATIQNTARLGIYGPPVAIDLATAEQWKQAYRQEFWAVVEYWSQAGRMISRLAGGDPLQWGPMWIKDRKIYGPGGTWLDYSTIEFYEDVESGERYWRHRTRRGWTKLYSGKLVENVVQWLARIVLSQAMLRIVAHGYRILLCTHDEALVAIPKDSNEQGHLERCMTEMRKTPEWLPGLPLDCDGSLGERYSK